MAMMWRDFQPEVWLQNENGHGWHAFYIYGSVIQGNQEGSPAFCILIAAVLHTVVHHPDLASYRLQVIHWMYVDDWVIQVPLAAAGVLLDVVTTAAAARNLPLQLQKCAFHVPALARKARHDWPAEAVALSERISFRQDGLVLLGTEACGDLAIPLKSLEAAIAVPEQTLKRKAKAIRLADATMEVLKLAPPAAAKQAVFSVNRAIVSHALDYDAGVVPCSALLPHARDLDQTVLAVACATFDARPEQLSEMEMQQLSLPVAFAGLQVDLPSHIIPLARAARLVETGPALRAAISSWTPESMATVDPSQHDGVDEAVQGQLLEQLRERGIHTLTGNGRPGASSDSAAPDPLRPAAPHRHLLSLYLRHCAAKAYGGMLSRAAERDRTRLLSASGPTSGTSLVCDLSTPCTSYTDRQWTEVLRWRLGIAMPRPPQVCCQNTKASSGEQCNEDLDPEGDHAVCCPYGPFRNFRHDDISDVYADIFVETGASARREVFVPEFFGGGADAFLDTWGFGTPDLPDCLVDVTVRHPFAERYQPLASNAAGSAAEQAEKEKIEKYPSSGGRCVVAAAHETWGRLGVQAEDLLLHCAAAVRRRHLRRGRTSGNCLRRWRAQLDAALMRGIAAQLTSARFGLPGRVRRRVPPESAMQLEACCPLGL